jgi:hypothetical protein
MTIGGEFLTPRAKGTKEQEEAGEKMKNKLWKKVKKRKQEEGMGIRQGNAR